MSASQANKAVARHALKALGGTPDVHAYRHDTIEMSVDILACANRPYAGVTSYSTLGLSDHPMSARGQELSVRLELVAACASANSRFANIVASAAFSIRRSGGVFRPGSVIRDCVTDYYPDSPVRFLYLTAPFLWEDRLIALDAGTKQVAWLMLVPITDAEQEYLKQRGDDAFEDLLERNDVDVFDLYRPSAA